MQVFFASPACAHFRKFAAKMIDVLNHTYAQVASKLYRDKGTKGICHSLIILERE